MSLMGGAGLLANNLPAPLTEVAAPWTEETVKQCLYLYLALLPQNHKLIHELAAVYTEAIADIKRTVLRVIEQPVSAAQRLWGWGGPVPDCHRAMCP